MKRKKSALVWLVSTALVFACCLFVFLSALGADWLTRELEPFELLARLLGYGLALCTLALCGKAALGIPAQGGDGKGALRATVFTGLAAALLLAVHDVLLYLEYGNVLEGAFTMTAYFAMDAGLLLLYAAAAAQTLKRPEAPLALWLSLAIFLLWLCYIVGDMAGYPTAEVADWDEAVMKLAIAFPFLMRIVAKR